MLPARYLAVATLCAATIAMVGCTGDNPTQSTNPTGTTGGTLSDPFASLSQGAASLQQAAGMAGDARSSGLTTVAPLQQAASGYRAQSVGAYESEPDGPYTTTFHITAENITGDWTSDITVQKQADYVTKSDEDAEVETGQASRQLHMKNESTKYTVDVLDVRQVATSTRRPVGQYGTFGLQTLTATTDTKVVYVYHQPTGQASTSLAVVMVDQYDEGTGDTLAKKIANRGAKTAEAIVMKGTLPSGESIDFTRGRAGKGNLQGRYFEGTLDLGANGKVGLKSTMGWAFTDALPNFPSVASGSLSIKKLTTAGQMEGEIFINQFDCRPVLQVAHTTGVLKDAQGATIGAFEGLINKRTGKWLGTYQMTGQASKSIDFSGIIEHLL
ncbi:MAG TPA: hypothetical protein V6D05_15225 [Stenomitos sp.]